jgi:3-hydroxyisobutyrate dehydrogenase
METPETRSETVAVIGTGIMGSAMAGSLLRAGLPTIVWDRSPSVTKVLADQGARVAATPGDAVAESDVVITMLPTGAITRSLILDNGVVDSFKRGAVLAQMGTIGIEATVEAAKKLQELRPDVSFVDAPVSGSKGPAAAGELLILASGPREVRSKLEPVFSAIGRKTVWLGEAGEGTKMKLVVNSYMCVLIEGVAEALELANRLGVDPSGLEEAIAGGPLDAPIADAKLHKMETGDYAPEFPLEWALKDVDLAITASGGALPLLAALSTQWHGAVDAGHGREDVSAARLALR